MERKFELKNRKHFKCCFGLFFTIKALAIGGEAFEKSVRTEVGHRDED